MYICVSANRPDTLTCPCLCTPSFTPLCVLLLSALYHVQNFALLETKAVLSMLYSQLVFRRPEGAKEERLGYRITNQPKYAHM